MERKAYNSTLSRARKPMKRTPFTSKVYEFRNGDGKPRSAPKRTKTPFRGPKMPKWLRAIPESSAHGSGTLQKRLWRVTSDFVRIRDWYLHEGVCVATGDHIGHWSDGDAGHWKSYAVCNGLFKFDPMNIHLQSKASNGWGGQEIGHQYGENLKARYTPELLAQIQVANQLAPLKFTTAEVIGMIRARIDDLADLPEQPDYYARVIHLLSLEDEN